MRPNIKALALIAMGIFLYTRYSSGKLLFYINERFSWLTLFAAVGFIVLGISYSYTAYKRQHHDHDHHDHHHDHDHNHDHSHGEIGWLGLALIMSPVILGVLVPPKPLGAAAMSNRDISTEALTSVSASRVEAVLSRPSTERNILDWLVEFRSTTELEQFVGQEAQVVGFVYRDERFGEDMFMTSRFIISCCAADASPIGLITQWPNADALPADQWVEIYGTFEIGEFDGQLMPILQVDELTTTEMPAQPYLYP